MGDDHDAVRGAHVVSQDPKARLSTPGVVGSDPILAPVTTGPNSKGFDPVVTFSPELVAIVRVPRVYADFSWSLARNRCDSEIRSTSIAIASTDCSMRWSCSDTPASSAGGAPRRSNRRPNAREIGQPTMITAQVMKKPIDVDRLTRDHRALVGRLTRVNERHILRDLLQHAQLCFRFAQRLLRAGQGLVGRAALVVGSRFAHLLLGVADLLLSVAHPLLGVAHLLLRVPRLLLRDPRLLLCLAHFLLRIAGGLLHGVTDGLA